MLRIGSGRSGSGGRGDDPQNVRACRNGRLDGGRLQHIEQRARAGAAPAAPPSGTPIVIGFPADLTTDWAYYDKPMEQGAQFAVDQINDAGGILGRPLELKTVDMRDDVAEGAKVTQQLIDDGAAYLIGTVGDGILAEGQVACAAGVPISTGLGTAPTLVGGMGDCAYQLVMSDNIQAAVDAEYALKQGYKTAYLLGSNEIPYTKDLPVYFSAAFEHGGGTIVGTDEYKIGAGDYSAVVTKVTSVNPPPDAIFTPMFIPDSVVFLRQLRQAGLDDPGALDRRERRPGAVGRRQEGDRRAHVQQLGLHGRGRPQGADLLQRLQGSLRERPRLLRRGDRLRRGEPRRAGDHRRGGTDPAALKDQLAHADYTGISGHVVMDPTTRRANKPASLIQMQGTTFTCLGVQPFPSFVAPPAG